MIRFHASSIPTGMWIGLSGHKQDFVFIREFLRPGDIYIDVGANVGTTVIPAAIRVGSKGMVYAFEPHPRIFSYLKSNVRLNKLANVVTYNFAVGQCSGELGFSDLIADDMNFVLDKGKIAVPAITLDDCLAGTARIALLKIDVEGYEKFVLLGSVETLKKTECIYLELSAAHFAKYGYQTKDILELLTKNGFCLFREVELGCFQAIDPNYLQQVYNENLMAARHPADVMARSGWQLIGAN